MDTNQRQIKEVPFRVHYTSASHKTDWLFKMQTYALKKTTKLATILLNLANNNKKKTHLFVFTSVHKFFIVMELVIFHYTDIKYERKIRCQRFPFKFRLDI